MVSSSFRVRTLVPSATPVTSCSTNSVRRGVVVNCQAADTPTELTVDYRPCNVLLVRQRGQLHRGKRARSGLASSYADREDEALGTPDNR